MNDRTGDGARVPPGAGAPRARLTCTAPNALEIPAASLDFELAGGGKVVIGREESCGICLRAAGLSRRHARLIAAPEGWTVEDLGSTNGVYVNGRRVRTARLAGGDELRLGALSFVYSVAPPPAAAGADAPALDPTLPTAGREAAATSDRLGDAGRESALRRAMKEARPIGGGRARAAAPAPSPRADRRMVYLFAAAVAALIIAGLVAYSLLAPGGSDRTALRPPPSLPADSASAPPAAAPVRSAARQAGYAEIAGNVSHELMLFRYRGNDGVLVLDYPSLTAQGRALNRVIALVEDRGAPRDRVLSDGDLADYIRATQSSPETFAFGHDYRAGDVVRFFNLADRGGVTLNVGEERLRAILVEHGFMVREDGGYRVVAPEQVVISVPQEQADDPGTLHDERVEPLTRRTILQHELSHAEFFLNPAYRDYCARFWRDRLSEAERAAFRAFLTSRDYDADNEVLAVNEMQAYLMHTPDRRLFSATHLGVTQEALDGLRRRFMAGVPPSRFFADVVSPGGAERGG